MKKKKLPKLESFSKDEQELFFSEFLSKFDKTDVSPQVLLELVKALEWIKKHDRLFIKLLENEVKVLGAQPYFVSGNVSNQDGSFIANKTGVKVIMFEDYEKLIERLKEVA